MDLNVLVSKLNSENEDLRNTNEILVFINCCLKAIDDHMISLEGLDHALKVVYGASSSLYEEIERMGGDYMFNLLGSACESTTMTYLKPSARLRNNPCTHTNAIGVL